MHKDTQQESGENIFHHAASLFPLMSPSALADLAADIEANGLREAIVMHAGKIIDGRNRYLACMKAGVKPAFRAWDGGGDISAFVVSVNLHRRHLNESQRAMVAAKIAIRETGRTKQADIRASEGGSPIGPPALTRKEAGELLNVGVTAINRAKAVRSNGTPEVISAVESGEVSLHLAEKVIDLPKSEQASAMKRRQLLKGKQPGRRVSRGNGFPMKKTNAANAIKVSINTDSPEDAAAALFAALETAFLEKLIAEMSDILARRKAAQQRGMGRKE